MVREHATLSNERKLLKAAEELGISLDFMSKLGELDDVEGASAATLSRMKSAGKALSNKTSSGLLKLTQELRGLRSALHPIPIQFEDAEVIMKLIRAGRDDKLKISVVLDGKDEVARRLAEFSQED
jgi:hypothetical protein